MSDNQLAQKGQIIRTGVEERGTFQALLIQSLFQFLLSQLDVQVIILLHY